MILAITVVEEGRDHLHPPAFRVVYVWFRTKGNTAVNAVVVVFQCLSACWIILERNSTRSANSGAAMTVPYSSPACPALNLGSRRFISAIVLRGVAEITSDINSDFLWPHSLRLAPSPRRLRSLFLQVVHIMSAREVMLLLGRRQHRSPRPQHVFRLVCRTGRVPVELC